MNDEPYIPKSLFEGGITAAMLFQTLRAQGMSAFAARSQLEFLIRADDIRTEPPLPAPSEILLHEDLLGITFVTSQCRYIGDEVKFFVRKKEQPTVRRGRGASDNYDWERAFKYWYNLRLFRRTEGKSGPTPKEVGNYFADHGDKRVPSVEQLRRKVREWRKRVGEN